MRTTRFALRTEAVAAPRLFGILAARAPVVAVLRRGPSNWWHVGAWHLDEPHYQPGAWFKALLYPQKCDLSPDGRWLAYSALNAGSSWPAGEIYEAISRLPWLTALAAWEAGTTYTTGIHFDDDPGVSEIGDPDVGDAEAVLAKYGLKITPRAQFAVERRRGWVETPDTPSREEGGAWDDRRRVAMEKPQPGRLGGPKLMVEGSYGGFRSLPSYFDPVTYSLQWDDDLIVLDDVQWAEWSSTGELTVASRGGALEIRTLHQRHIDVSWSHDLSAMQPDPQPPPRWAREW